MIAIIDYGVGNLFSLCGSLAYAGIESRVTSDPDELRAADRIILPGVGAFGDAAEKFRESGLEPVLQEQVKSGKMLLGICVGMQLLFERGYEFGVHEGLHYIEGSIHPLKGDIPADLKVPQIGWNSLEIREKDPILKYTRNGDYVYYVHSYYAKHCQKSVLASSEYGVTLPGLVKCENVYGTQFHPEKSGRVGLDMLRAFNEL